MVGAWNIVAATALMIGLACGVSSRAAANVVRDDLQRDVRFSSAPRRIITLLPSLTETVCALGACDRLLATDRYSDWPVQVNSLPKAGGIDDAQIELIVSLKPDVVLLSRAQRITERLQELRITSFALETDRYADIAHTVSVIGEIIGERERAARLVESIEDDVRAVSAKAIARRRGDGPAVYFEVDRAPYAAGPGSFIGELLTRLGTRNIVHAALGAFPKLNPEYVVREDPDVIFVTAAESPHLAERPGWDSIRAVRENRICSFDAAVSDTIVRPGPRVAAGMRAIDDCLARVAP
jgi:iron complex transport system substrate-binding protein